MFKNMDYRAADWTCPYVENRDVLTNINRNPDLLTAPVPVEAGSRTHYVLPAWQNLEAVALSRTIAEKKSASTEQIASAEQQSNSTDQIASTYQIVSTDQIVSTEQITSIEQIASAEQNASAEQTVSTEQTTSIEQIASVEHNASTDRSASTNRPVSSEYCVSALSELEDIDFALLSDPLMQKVVRTISLYKEDPLKPLILEAEAPFSVLAALMNPVDLYLCFEEESELLKRILFRIARAEATYIKACVEAGCRIISLADPVGTMDLVGPDYYRDLCGASEIALMNMCQPFLDHALIHICKKMSQSLLLADLVEIRSYKDTCKKMSQSPLQADLVEIQSYKDTCKKMSQSPQLADFEEVLPYKKQDSGIISKAGIGYTESSGLTDQDAEDKKGYESDAVSGEEDYVDRLFSIASDPRIHFVGMTCIHNRYTKPEEIFLLRIK